MIFHQKAPHVQSRYGLFDSSAHHAHWCSALRPPDVKYQLPTSTQALLPRRYHGTHATLVVQLKAVASIS